MLPPREWRPKGSLPPVPPALLELVQDHRPIRPVVVRSIGEGRYEILDNVEAWRAVQQAGQHRVPIYVCDDIDDDEAFELVQRTFAPSRPDPIVEARQFAERLEAYGGSGHRAALRRVAAEADKSRSYVTHALRLLRLPRRIQQMLSAGVLQVGHAKPLVTLGDRKKQIRLAERVIRGGLSVRATEQLARGRKPQPDKRAARVPEKLAPSVDPAVRSLEKELSDTIGCETIIDTDRGRLVIDYCQDLDILQGVLQRLGCASN